MFNIPEKLCLWNVASNFTSERRSHYTVAGTLKPRFMRTWQRGRYGGKAPCIAYLDARFVGDINGLAASVPYVFVGSEISLAAVTITKLSSPFGNRSRSSRAGRLSWLAQVGQWLSCGIDEKYRGSITGKGTVLFLHGMVVCSGAYPASSSPTNGGFRHGIERSPPSSTEVKYLWSRNSTCPYITINGWIAFVAATTSVIS